MKKIVLSLASVLAATAFAPEASAIPSFARQTGMACTACHAQHFPVLNSFGRAFKSAGFTMMGAQGKVEGDHLSIPDALNASILFKTRYVKADRTGVVGAGKTAAPNTGDGQWQFGDEISLFFGGRIAENVGFAFEGNVAGGATTANAAAGAPVSCVNNTALAIGAVAAGAAAAPVAGACAAGLTAVGGPAAAVGGGSGGSLLASLKIPFIYDLGGAKVGVIPFTTDAHGPMYSYDQSSGGVVRAIRWAEGRAETSAVQYMSTPGGSSAGAATGIALVASNDMGFVNVAKWSPSLLPGGNGQAIQSTHMKNNYIRIAATPTVGNWAMIVGAGSISGSSFSNVTLAEEESRKTFFDFEAHGEVAGKEMAVYAQHAKAPQGSFGKANAYNTTVCTAAGCGADRRATTIGADYSVIPHVLSLGLAYRDADTGNTAVNVATLTDNAWTVTAVYDLYQNVALHLNYAKFNGTSRTAATAEKSRTYLMLEAAF